MVKKYRFGKPFDTEAVVSELKAEEGTDDVIGAGINILENGLSIRMAERTMVFGLGENMHGINKRGNVYVSNNSDDPHHQEDKVSLYGSHNFIVAEDYVLGEGLNTIGIFIDYPGKLRFDIGFTHTDELRITFEDMDFELYLIEPEDVDDALVSIVSQFRRMTGKSYIPPRWAFGYGQSRWSYPDEASVREIARKHKENSIPLDMIYLDIDYMDSYMDFTVNKEAFPDLSGLSRELKEEGIYLVPIIDAGVKKKEGYDIDEEGLDKDYFCENEEGEVFEAAVWPGISHFPDVLRPEVREWFGAKYERLTSLGIEGFWNDMNEPALFYTKRGLDKLYDKVERYKGNYNLSLEEFWDMTGASSSISNNNEDYSSIYHNTYMGRICHDKVHNLYGFNMTRAAGEALERISPDKRMLLFSRSSYIGMHRYGGIWTGDNKAWWSHLLLNIKMMPSLNMCGFIYSGADLGGFGTDTNEELMLRWLEFGIFTPLMRNHSALGTRLKEAYQFDDTRTFSNIIGLRYMLLPYIYSEYLKAVNNDGVYFKTLHMVYPMDEIAREVEDQLMVGDNLMIAPVYEQNKTGRYVYLPENMLLLRFRAYDDYDEEYLEKGHHYIWADKSEVLIFLRKDRKLPLSMKKHQTVGDIDFNEPTVISYSDKAMEYEYYMDDGVSRNGRVEIRSI